MFVAKTSTSDSGEASGRPTSRLIVGVAVLELRGSRRTIAHARLRLA
jgi:hypothetical protein